MARPFSDMEVKAPPGLARMVYFSLLFILSSAALGLRCCAAFLSWGERGLLSRCFVQVSLAVEHRLRGTWTSVVEAHRGLVAPRHVES